MGGSKKYERLDCYQLAIRLAAEIIPFSSRIKPFRFSEQIAASAVSISSNIAEGAHYQNDKDFIRFLRYARGSAAELDSQLSILIKMGHPEINSIDKWRDEISSLQGMITNLQKYLRNTLES